MLRSVTPCGCIPRCSWEGGCVVRLMRFSIALACCWLSVIRLLLCCPCLYGQCIVARSAASG
eukprot:362866-Chlamydomonas_euryale.AAC.38